MIDRPRDAGPDSDDRRARMQEDIRYTLEQGYRIPLPDFFRPSFGDAFVTCIGCAERLEALSLYLVVKEVRAGETIVEYAICSPCQHELSGQYSARSQENIDRLFAANVDFRKRWDDFVVAGAGWEAWLDACILTGEPVTAESEYQAVAFCADEDLILSSWPYLIADRGMRLFEDCLSPGTLEVRDRFIRQRLGLPSIFSDHPATRLRNPPV